MFDIGWTEMLVVAVVAIVVVGPKDLPQMLRAFGKAMTSIRKMAGDFQKQFDDAIKESGLDDVKKIASGKTFQPLEDVRSSAQAFQKQVKEQMEKSVLPPKDSPETKLPDPVPDVQKPAVSAKKTKTSDKTDTVVSKVSKPAVKSAKPLAKAAAAKPAKPAKIKPAAGKKA